MPTEPALASEESSSAAPHAFPRGARIALLVAMCALAVGAWSVFPDLVIVFNDDFGYLRSIVHTLERGRPWTDDWLEPWAASLSGISALVFCGTGSFRLATQGVQVVAIVATWLLATRCLRDRGVGWTTAALAAVLVITFPTLLFKSFEFGSMVVSVPCLLACAWCAARERWAWFFVAWLLAVSTRQSALAWLALPAWIAWREWRARAGSAGSHGAWRGPAAVVVLGVVAYLALHATMNETYAQRTLTRGMWDQWEPAAAARSFGWAAGVFVIAIGISCFVQGLAAAPAAAGAPSSRRGGRLLQLGAIVAVLAFLAIDPRRFVYWEHDLLEGERGRAYLGMLALIAAVGWWRAGLRVRGEWVCLALAATALVCLRRSVWDYYFTDIALAAALGATCGDAKAVGEGNSSPAPSAVARTNSASRWMRSGALLAAIAVACWHVAFVRQMKRQFDAVAAVIALCETALRAGRISPTQLSLGPFGYQGWHWYPHFVKQDGPRGEHIGGFDGYVAGNSLAIVGAAPGEPPWRFGVVSVAPPLPAGSSAATREIASIVFRSEWTGSVRYELRLPESPETAPRKTVDASQTPYEPQRFPLSDGEWREWIAARRGR